MAPVQVFRIRSIISSARYSAALDGLTVETYAASHQPEGTLSSHLTFALYCESVELDFRSRLLESPHLSA